MNKRYYINGRTNSLSTVRQTELRRKCLIEYKWRKRNGKPLHYKDIFIYVGAMNKKEEGFIVSYFKWLANKFGRI